MINARYELKTHRSNGDTRDGNASVHEVGPKLRNYARHLDQNHDLAKGALDRLTQFVVGPNGIGIEPQPRTRTGETHTAYAAQMLEAWRDWAQFPDVTWEHDWPACQRLACRSWLRDGEVLTSLISGTRPDLDHGTRVPFSIELIEADFLPFQNTDSAARILHSVERNAWNRPVAYWLYKEHPGGVLRTDYSLKRVLSKNLLHLKMTDRIGQVRGVPIFASVLTRMNDLYEYETAERIAARIAASITGSLKTENPGVYTPSSADDQPRDLSIQPGMILDNLRPGESLDIISSNRPSAMLEPFRNGQLRAVSSGIGLSYSALSRDYNGTYSAQRQELVEQFDAYRILSNQFISQWVRPIWQEFVRLFSNIVPPPRDLDLLTLNDATFQPPAIPWIDPSREASAQSEQLGNYLTSPQALIRQRGNNPDDVLAQWQQWNRKLDERGLTPAAPRAAQPQPEPKTP